MNDRPVRPGAPRSLGHLFLIWLINGTLGGFLIAFFHNEHTLKAYLNYAFAGLVLMFFIIGVIAFANRFVRPRFFPQGITFRGSAVIAYTIWFLVLTALATLAAFWVLDHTLVLTRGIMSNPQAVGTTLMYVLLFAALNLISTYAVAFYHEVHQRVRAEAKVEQEMRLAAEVQQALLPSASASGRSHYEVSGTSVPSRSIGGDFFDDFELADGGIGFVLADVAGKGAPAALLAAAAQGMIRMACVPDRPSTTLQRVNAALARRTGSSRFVTAFHGVLSPDGRLRSSNAGHLPAFILRGSGEIVRLDADGLPLGAFEDATYEERETRLVAGDKIVVFSDGVTEALSADGQQFGLEKAEAVLADAPRTTAVDLMARLVTAVQGFANGRAPEDDLTVLVVRYEG